MEEDEGSDVLYDHAGDIYDALGDKKKALEMWGKALEINSGNSDVKLKIEKADLENL